MQGSASGGSRGAPGCLLGSQVGMEVGTIGKPGAARGSVGSVGEGAGAGGLCTCGLWPVSVLRACAAGSWPARGGNTPLLPPSRLPPSPPAGSGGPTLILALTGISRVYSQTSHFGVRFYNLEVGVVLKTKVRELWVRSAPLVGGWGGLGTLNPGSAPHSPPTCILGRTECSLRGGEQPASS